MVKTGYKRNKKNEWWVNQQVKNSVKKSENYFKKWTEKNDEIKFFPQKITWCWVSDLGIG